LLPRPPIPLSPSPLRAPLWVHSALDHEFQRQREEILPTDDPRRIDAERNAMRCNDAESDAGADKDGRRFRRCCNTPMPLIPMEKAGLAIWYPTTARKAVLSNIF
jgi:hypothetical protein